MDAQLVTKVMEAWHDARGSADDELRRLLREVADPTSWAVLDGPRVALLFDDQRVMFVTAPTEDRVMATCRRFPKDTEITSEAGDWKQRLHTNGQLRHWTFNSPDAEPLKITGWGAQNECDQREKFARALADACGWPF